MLIGVDPGNHTTKACAREKHIKFPSTVGTGRECLLRRRENDSDLIVTANGKTYFVGALARESHDASLALDETRTDHEYTVILILTAVSLLAEKDGWLNVTAVVGMPIIHYRDRAIRQRLVDRLTCQAHEVTVQGVRRVINFAQVIVFPEGAAALFSVMSPEFESNRIGIVDAGSWRSNYAVLDAMEYEDKNSGTLPLGMHQALLMVGENRLMHEVEAAAERDKELAAELAEARRSKARQLADSVRGKWSDMDFFALFISGGGAQAVKEYFPAAVTMPDAQMANAKGLLKVGELIERDVSSRQSHARTP